MMAACGCATTSPRSIPTAPARRRCGCGPDRRLPPSRRPRRSSADGPLAQPPYTARLWVDQEPEEPELRLPEDDEPMVVMGEQLGEILEPELLLERMSEE